MNLKVHYVNASIMIRSIVMETHLNECIVFVSTPFRRSSVIDGYAQSDVTTVSPYLMPFAGNHCMQLSDKVVYYRFR